MFRLGLHCTPPKVNRVPRFPRLAENNIRTGFLEDGQFEKLVSFCPELWFQAIVEVGSTYGWRIGELLQLRVEQVDLPAKVIRLEPGTTKNRDGREVTMTASVYALLAQCVTGKQPEDFVFCRPDGKPVLSFKKMWRNACIAAGVPSLLFHDLRRTAARNLRRAGVAEGVIMKIGGWRTRSVFERYAIVSQTDIADAMRSLESQQNGHRNGHSGESLRLTPGLRQPVKTLRPNLRLRKILAKSCFSRALGVGAGRGNRTPKGRSPADFESESPKP